MVSPTGGRGRRRRPRPPPPSPSSRRTSSRPASSTPSAIADERPLRLLDPHPPAEGEQTAPRSRGARGVEIAEPVDVPGEERVEQRRAGRPDGRPRGCTRSRSSASSAGTSVHSHVHAEADHQRVARRLGEDPAQLALAHEEVVRPLHARPRPRWSPRPPRPSPARPRSRAGGAAPPGAAGRSSTEASSDAPGGATHVRPSRPRPAVWWSATATTPAGAPARASSTR